MHLFIGAASTPEAAITRPTTATHSGERVSMVAQPTFDVMSDKLAPYMLAANKQTKAKHRPRRAYALRDEHWKWRRNSLQERRKCSNERADCEAERSG
jgi:hypothetical protein